MEIGEAIGFDFCVEWGGAIRRAPPAYTASLDAAMTLVPEGWNYGIFPKCAQLTHGPTTALKVVIATAATPALALTAAALRSHKGEGK